MYRAGQGPPGRGLSDSGKRIHTAGRFLVAPEGVERSEEHTSELQSLRHLVCRLLLGKKTNACWTSKSVWSEELSGRMRAGEAAGGGPPGTIAALPEDGATPPFSMHIFFFFFSLAAPPKSNFFPLPPPFPI